MKRYFWLLILAALIIGCDSQSNKQAGGLALFQNLALSEVGLRFPRSRDHLEICRRVRDDHCLRAYESFREAKDELLAMSRHDALELILARLRESCVAKPPAEFKFVCSGTVIALYFFSEAPEEKRIRQFLSQLTKPAREIALDRSISTGVSWLDSRADKKAWRSWLESHVMDKVVRTLAITRLDSPDPQSNSLYDVILNTEGQ
jgi:hypothetical protein